MQQQKSNAVLEALRNYESRNVTFIEADGSWPIVWERAAGVHVWDLEGRKYLDLTAAFGVAATGHANPRVVRAGQVQMAHLLHAMGDVHPHALKARLARELSRLTFERWSRPNLGTDGAPTQSKAGPNRQRAKTIFCNSGFEAVEAALKTAALATGKPGVIAFTGAYHGLGYGALNVTHRGHFRAPFLGQLAEFGRFARFPGTRPSHRAGTHPRANSLREGKVDLDSVASQLRQILKRGTIGAVLVEPIQVRGGVNIPPSGFLRLLHELCAQNGALLLLDEIYTGFGRTGKWFACEHESVQPDVICLGKALTGGFPLAACVGRADVMDAAWPPSTGEAIHTSTFLGHPVGCAMALAQLEEITTRRLVQRSASLGHRLLSFLADLERCVPGLSACGLGLLAGVELTRPDGQPATTIALAALKAALHRGYIFLPEGEFSNIISFTPPLTISEPQLRCAVEALAEVLTAHAKQHTI